MGGRAGGRGLLRFLARCLVPLLLVLAALTHPPGPSPARVDGATSRGDLAGAGAGPGLPGQSGQPGEPVTEADGLLPDGVSAFDDRYPGVADLDPALLQALRRAAADAADDGTALVVNSGWRSRRYQEQLLAEAVARHGSHEEAARWVATADTSAHVSGDAVDVGPAAAAAWLAEHGARYGVCRVYRNEPWHFELRPRAVEEGCPPAYADPAHDPRMQR
ncbi:M15 family metallopeptidase [Kineococcus sp. SYSU DK006]|uniref:M15 family metallopeptidase n=1 Tax=Kineococcus sp. SYSU DK006 TaxID=3383127 RepID=UPI003D7C79B6